MPRTQNVKIALTTEVASAISLVVFEGLPAALLFCYCYYFFLLFTVWQVKKGDCDGDDDHVECPVIF